MAVLGARDKALGPGKAGSGRSHINSGPSKAYTLQKRHNRKKRVISPAKDDREAGLS